MPAGCDLVCCNPLCKHEGKFIAITSPWPMGYIGNVIQSLNDSEDSFLIQNLKEKEAKGIKYACLSLPNKKNIEVVAYRICFWHPTKNLVCEYNLELNNRTKEDALNDPNIPTSCPETGVKLVSFDEVLEKDIKCPFCNENMKKIRWFSNE